LESPGFDFGKVAGLLSFGQTVVLSVVGQATNNGVERPTTAHATNNWETHEQRPTNMAIIQLAYQCQSLLPTP
jgi:hypothetical protein